MSRVKKHQNIRNWYGEGYFDGSIEALEEHAWGERQCRLVRDFALRPGDIAYSPEIEKWFKDMGEEYIDDGKKE